MVQLYKDISTDPLFQESVDVLMIPSRPNRHFYEVVADGASKLALGRFARGLWSQFLDCSQGKFKSFCWQHHGGKGTVDD